MSGPFRALVFGGSGAVGAAVCRALAAEGVRLAFTYRTGEKAALDLAKEIPGSLALPLDLLSVRDIDRTVDSVGSSLGGLDAFVQCAGIAVPVECAGVQSHHLMPEIDEAAWDRILNVNARSTFFAVRRVSEILKRGGGGNIVFIGSVDGVKPAPSPVHYAASKGALAGMTQAMAKELGGHGIRVNMVAPGILEAGLSRSLPEPMLKEYVKHCGLKRVGTLAEVAAIVAWLARHNTYVTGRVLLADGAL